MTPVRIKPIVMANPLATEPRFLVTKPTQMPPTAEVKIGTNVSKVKWSNMENHSVDPA